MFYNVFDVFVVYKITGRKVFSGSFYERDGVGKGEGVGRGFKEAIGYFGPSLFYIFSLF
jgi:hypothetical protein